MIDHMVSPLRVAVSLPGGLRTFVACVCLALASVYAYTTWHAREIAERVALHETVNLAASLAQQAADTMETADGALLALVDSVEAHGTGQPSLGTLQTMMARDVVAMPRLHLLLIVDSGGRVVVDNMSASGRPDLNYRDREYFHYHRTHDNEAVHISGPLRSKTENLWNIIVSRRIERPDGEFGGVAVAEISLDYFERTYASVDIGRLGVIDLVRDDGTIVVRWPFNQQYIGRSIAKTAMFAGPLRYDVAGSDTMNSVIDGVRRLNAFRRLDRYPLVVIVALAEREYLANWVSDAISHAIGTLTIVAMIVSLGSVLAMQIDQRKQAEHALARLALIDGLTEIPNRRQFDEALSNRWGAAKRDTSSLALLMIDADNFKSFNDRYGHQHGDEALKTIAATITECIRPLDLGARYGGEEFAVILPSTDRADAMRVGERIRLAVAARRVPHAGGADGIVTVSIGVGAMFPVLGGDSAQLIAAADRALYDAKATGRNRTRAFADGRALEAVSPRDGGA